MTCLGSGKTRTHAHKHGHTPIRARAHHTHARAHAHTLGRGGRGSGIEECDNPEELEFVVGGTFLIFSRSLPQEAVEMFRAKGKIHHL